MDLIAIGLLASACCRRSGLGFICRCPCFGDRRKRHNPSSRRRSSQFWANSLASPLTDKAATIWCQSLA